MWSQLRELDAKTQFAKFDTDGNGSIDADELLAAMHACGHATSTTEDAHALLREHGDGEPPELDSAQFQQVLESIDSTHHGEWKQEQQLADAAAVADVATVSPPAETVGDTADEAMEETHSVELVATSPSPTPVAPTANRCSGKTEPEARRDPPPPASPVVVAGADASASTIEPSHFDNMAPPRIIPLERVEVGKASAPQLPCASTAEKPGDKEVSCSASLVLLLCGQPTDENSEQPEHEYDFSEPNSFGEDTKAIDSDRALGGEGATTNVTVVG